MRDVTKIPDYWNFNTNVFMPEFQTVLDEMMCIARLPQAAKSDVPVPDPLPDPLHNEFRLTRR